MDPETLERHLFMHLMHTMVDFIQTHPAEQFTTELDMLAAFVDFQNRQLRARWLTDEWPYSWRDLVRKLGQQ